MDCIHIQPLSARVRESLMSKDSIEEGWSSWSRFILKELERLSNWMLGIEGKIVHCQETSKGAHYLQWSEHDRKDVVTEAKIIHTLETCKESYARRWEEHDRKDATRDEIFNGRRKEIWDVVRANERKIEGLIVKVSLLAVFFGTVGGGIGFLIAFGLRFFSQGGN